MSEKAESILIKAFEEKRLIGAGIGQDIYKLISGKSMINPIAKEMRSIPTIEYTVKKTIKGADHNIAQNIWEILNREAEVIDTPDHYIAYAQKSCGFLFQNIILISVEIKPTASGYHTIIIKSYIKPQKNDDKEALQRITNNIANMIV